MKPAILTGVALAALTLSTGAVLASSHGNDLVHNRKFKGVVYTMNQVHMSLYTYAKDAPGVSNCYGSCAKNWPPALLPAGSDLGENFSLIPRSDGTMQIAYKGKPLYLYAKDKKVGDMKGDGVGGVWHLSTP